MGTHREGPSMAVSLSCNLLKQLNLEKNTLKSRIKRQAVNFALRERNNFLRTSMLRCTKTKIFRYYSLTYNVF